MVSTGARTNASAKDYQERVDGEPTILVRRVFVATSTRGSMKDSIIASTASRTALTAPLLLLLGCVGQAHAQTPPPRADAGAAQANGSNSSVRAAAQSNSVLNALGTSRSAPAGSASASATEVSVADSIGGRGGTAAAAAAPQQPPQAEAVGTIGIGALGTRSRAIGPTAEPRPRRMLRGRTTVRGPGFAEAVAVRVMRRWSAQFQYCFDTTVGTTNTTALSVTMSFNVRAAGAQRTENIDVQFVGTTDQRLITCLRSRLAPVQFPQPSGAQRVPVVHVFAY